MGNNRISGTATLEGDPVEGAYIVVFRFVDDGGSLSVDVADVVQTDANGDYSTDLLPERDEWHTAIEFEDDVDSDGNIEQFADLSKPFVEAGPYLRAASGSGIGAGDAVFVRIRTAEATTASGVGTATADGVRVRPAAASGTVTATGTAAAANRVRVGGDGSSVNNDGTAIAVRVRVRSAAGSATGTGASIYVRIRTRQATGSTTTSGVVANRTRIRTSSTSNQGIGTGTAARPERIRTASAAGQATGTGSATVLTVDFRTLQMLARRNNDVRASVIEAESGASPSQAQAYKRRGGSGLGRREDRR